VNATKERQAWCCLQVKLCDPCLSTLCVSWCKKALYKYSSFLFLSFKDERRFSFCVCLGLAFCVYFWFSFDCFVLVLFASVVLGLGLSVLCQVIG